MIFIFQYVKQKKTHCKLFGPYVPDHVPDDDFDINAEGENTDVDELSNDGDWETLRQDVMEATGRHEIDEVQDVIGAMKSRVKMVYDKKGGVCSDFLHKGTKKKKRAKQAQGEN